VDDLGKGFRAERRLDPGAHGVEIHPSFRAFSTWTISSRSVSARRDATARSPTSGSVLAALWAISSAGSMHVSIC
jgi:hypothetical protein